MTIVLRDYQQEAVEAVFSASNEGIKRQLIALPTGAGKTIVMAAIAKTADRKTLLIAHREELITQAVDKFRFFWPDVSIGVCMGERDEIDTQVVVASVQSASRPKRLARLKAQGFELLMIDEAHHSVADSYKAVISELGFADGSDKLMVGVSATPGRSGLGTVFERIVFNRSIATMIKAGYLAPVVGRRILTSFVLDRVRTKNGDFMINELSELVNTPERNAYIVEKFQAYAPDRKGIGFCCDVAHCHDLANAFNAAGITAAAVWGDMEPERRRQVLSDLKSGRIQIATSCGVLVEGFDEPSISTVIMARPTRSAALYVQSAGRGLRLHPGKADCLILDFSDRGHNLDTVMTLSCALPEATIAKDEEQERDDDGREEVDKRPKIELVDESDDEFDILGVQKFIWTDLESEYSLLGDDKKEIILKQNGNGWIAKFYDIDGSSRKIFDNPLPLPYAQGCAEDFARKNLKLAFADSNASWMQSEEPPTQGQKDLLEKLGAWDDNFSKAQAALEIRKQLALKSKRRREMPVEPITGPQKWFLNNAGINTDGMSKMTAMIKISEMKQKTG